MWEKILKVQVLGNKQRVKMGIKPLPKEEDDDCKRWLKGLYDVFKKHEHQSIGWSATHVFKSERIPEKESCAIKHYIENQHADKMNSYKHDFERIYYYRHKNQSSPYGSDYFTTIVFSFNDSLQMKVYMGNGNEGENDLAMNLQSSWSDLVEELTRWFYNGDRNLEKAPMIGSVKEICKYINRKDVWTLFKVELAVNLHPSDKIGMEIIAKLHQQGELDW